MAPTFSPTPGHYRAYGETQLAGIGRHTAWLVVTCPVRMLLWHPTPQQRWKQRSPSPAELPRDVELWQSRTKTLVVTAPKFRNFNMVAGGGPGRSLLAERGQMFSYLTQLMPLPAVTPSCPPLELRTCVVLSEPSSSSSLLPC